MPDAPARRPLPPKWSQLVISIAVGALLGLLWGLWRGDLTRWLLLGAIVGAVSGLWSELRLAREKRDREK
ncbi:hypothetical protein ACPYO6_16495 [Georgenia sp. Z1344]|uniref:hypothetical protein n=1 Tax=Georgenia sp. Z1344 TaxID=3416706 RepID=UPI003CF6BF7A